MKQGDTASTSCSLPQHQSPAAGQPPRLTTAAQGRIARWWHSLRPDARDLVMIGVGSAAMLLAAMMTDAFDRLHGFSHTHEEWHIDSVLTALVIAPFGLSIYAVRRLHEVRREAELRRLAQAEARMLAVHDALTGLPNRRRLAEGLHAALARARREGGAVAALLVDLDRFKPVNDLRGHAAGDRLLQMVAERLRGAAREVDIVARLGGDEFVVAAHFGATPTMPSSLAGDDVAGAEEAPDAAARLARRVVGALEQPFDLGDAAIPVLVGASVGVALAQDGEGQVEELLRRADVAMYRAKAEGRGCFRFFEAEMDARIRERAGLEADLRRAVAADELVPHFQPLIALGDGERLLGFEMLARWSHSVRGMVPPAEFITVAEDTGLIVPMCSDPRSSALRREIIGVSGP